MTKKINPVRNIFLNGANNVSSASDFQFHLAEDHPAKLGKTPRFLKLNCFKKRGFQKIEKVLFFSFLFLGLFVPLVQARAQLQLLAVLMAQYPLALFINFILAISNLLLALATGILNWVLSENFISWSYTNPLGEYANPIVNVGWTLMRDLVNMFFIVVLAFIGLATALRLREYELQKLLPRLILIALLINFSPVICGLIVDASNIVMNFFLEPLQGLDMLYQRFTAQYYLILDMLGEWYNPIRLAQKNFQAMVMTGFNTGASLLILLFVFLFAFRYIAIWILVILSPLAFFSYILPQTRGFWSKWWNWFLQWSMVGIFASFFLYLGNHILVNAPAMIKVPPPEMGGLESIWIEYLNSVVPYGFSLIFLALGFLIALQTSVMGANVAINLAQTTGKAVASKAASVGKRAGVAVGERTAKGLEGAEKFGQRQQEKGRQMGGLKGLALKTGGGLIKAAGAPLGIMGGWARIMTSKWRGSIAGELDSKISELEKMAKVDPQAVAAMIDTPEATTDPDLQMAAISALAKTRGGKGLDMVRGGKKRAMKILKRARGGFPEHSKEVLANAPELLFEEGGEEFVKYLVDPTDSKDKQMIAEIMKDRLVDETMAMKKLACRKLIRKLKMERIPDIPSEMMENNEIVEALTTTRDLGMLDEVIRYHPNALPKITEEVRTKVKEIYAENPRIIRQLETHPARWILGEEDRKAILEEAKDIEQKQKATHPPGPGP